MVLQLKSYEYPRHESLLGIRTRELKLKIDFIRKN